MAYSPLGRGFLTGRLRSLDVLDEGDFRRHQPRFQGENLEANVAIVDVVERVAVGQGLHAGQVALAFVHAQGATSHRSRAPSAAPISRRTWPRSRSN